MERTEWITLLNPEQKKKLETLEAANFEVSVRRYVDPENVDPSTYVIYVTRDDHEQFNTEVEGMDADGLPMLFEQAYRMAKAHHPELE